VSFLDEAKQEPWRFDFFATMRRLERSYQDRPRIGDSASMREEYLSLGQDPYLEFPASNLSAVEKTPNGRLRVLVKFLGLLGPQGALPLATTEEAYAWHVMRDDAFPRFLDLFNNRFLQLFFRAWADSRPIAQHDRPELDRFVTYIGSTIGLGSLPYQRLDSIPDAAKLGFAGLIGAKAKGASRLRSLIGGMFGAEVEIDEFVGSYLALDENERSRLGQRNSGLGASMLMGASVFSVQDKFRVRIYTKDMEEYLSFMPTGGRCEPLADLVFFYLGDELDWEVELAIPAGKVKPVELSKFGQLGWTTWMSPNWTSTDAYRRDARFHPREILKQKRKKSSHR
jgi:type VI secretion system protein ImpH